MNENRIDEEEVKIEREIGEAERDLERAEHDILEADKKLEHAQEELQELERERRKHCVEIIVEATPHEWCKEEISFAEVVTLEVPDYHKHPEITYAVTYEKGPKENPEGILLPHQKVRVKEGMCFHVSETGQS